MTKKIYSVSHAKNNNNFKIDIKLIGFFEKAHTVRIVIEKYKQIEGFSSEGRFLIGYCMLDDEHKGLEMLRNFLGDPVSK